MTTYGYDRHGFLASEDLGGLVLNTEFFDIDGTLIDIKTHRIPESTITALRQAKTKGNKIFIATGRSHTIVDLPGIPKDMIDGYVTLNGAICLVDGKPINLVKIPETTMREFSAHVPDYSGIGKPNTPTIYRCLGD